MIQRGVFVYDPNASVPTLRPRYIGRTFPYVQEGVYEAASGLSRREDLVLVNNILSPGGWI